MSALSENDAVTTYDHKMMKTIVLKLLDKAGNDKRLTLRILRNKTEDKLKLQRGVLKDKRNDIKSLTYKWWKTNNTNATAADKVDEKAPAATTTNKQQNSSSSSSSNSDELSQLFAVAKAIGKSSICKVMDSDTTTTKKEKANQLRKKLRELGYKFSDIPTSQEIDKAKKTYELKKEAANLQQNNDNLGSATTDGERKRKLTTQVEVSKDSNSNSKEDKDKQQGMKKEKLNHSQPTASSSGTTAGASISKLNITAAEKDATSSSTITTNVTVASGSSNGITIKKAVVKYDSDEEEGDF